MGSLTYEEARHNAEEALGDAFDPRDFHYHMLKYGDMAVESIKELGQDYLKQAQETTEDGSNAAAESSTSASPSYSQAVFIGSTVGGIVGGVVLGAVVGVLLAKRRKTQDYNNESVVDISEPNKA